MKSNTSAKQSIGSSWEAFRVSSHITPNVQFYHPDDKGQWVAELACDHNQHVRHDPPWMLREWVITVQGREKMLGFELECKKCDENAPSDRATGPVPE